MLHFDRFRFDAANRRLEDASGPIRLNPKAFAVLSALIERRGKLVSKDQLLDEIWPDTHVADGVLKVCVAEIRTALGDSATAPRFIETVHRLGYRFVANVTVEQEPAATSEPQSARSRSLLAWPTRGVAAGQSAVGLVGRSQETQHLEERLALALKGERQVVFVTGEPGAGKTAIVEDFVAGAARRHALAITGGQCLEQVSSAEAYMPVLEAVGRLVRDDQEVRSLLRRYAPTWFAQLPWLIEEEDRGRLERELFGAARERMLREIAEFVEALGAEIPLVLVLEDLHWSDPSTVDLLSLLAARREPARLLLIGTYRPIELILGRHPLRALSQNLVASRRSFEVALDPLDVGAVAEYLARRFVGGRFRPEVVKLIRERTDGNPLFLSMLVDHLLARHAIVERGDRWEAGDGLEEELGAVPESLRLLIDQQLERLTSDDRELLEAASLVGVEFSAAAAAAGVNRGTTEAEERFDRLAGAGPFLRHAGGAEWPDGTAAEVFAFRHSLYRETLAAAVPRGRRTDVHLRIGEALEGAYGERASELAAELAIHFEEAGDRARAARYRRVAAETAARRYAFAEAETHLERGLALLGALPASPDRDREELLLQSTLGPVLRATRGYGSSEAARAYARALELTDSTTPEPAAFPVLWGLWAFYIHGELDHALALAERNRAIAEASRDRLLRLEAHHALWLTHFFRGEFVAALGHLDAGEDLYDAERDRGSALIYVHDPKVDALSYRAFVLWYLGHVDQALENSFRSLEHARALGHPLSLAGAMHGVAYIRFLRAELEASREQAEALNAHARQHDLPHWEAHGLQLHGCVIAAQGELEHGATEMEKGLALATKIGTRVSMSHSWSNLAAARMRAGRLAEARATLEACKAFVAATGERFHQPEIHRVDAELVLAEAGGADAASGEARERTERLLYEAIECASRQGSRMFELRATTSLCRLHRRGAKGKRARDRLSHLLASLNEGLDTADLRAARELVTT